MAIKPILFSTDMVSAILDGRKTMTRRPVTGNRGKDYMNAPSRTNLFSKIEKVYGTWMGLSREGIPFINDPIKQPYKVGDVCWVRETWMPETEQGIPTGSYIYKATDKPEPDGDKPLKWRPSIHMPKEAARIFLRVTDVRVERVQDISAEDVAAEGLPSHIIPPGHEHYKNVCGKNWLGFENKSINRIYF